ncbi:hypothetical protein [Vulcanisaeta sp. JCM 16161]|uniref:hypothetical protein n=1 Tax=Vulcanisaeta sp. JCM 16161 TaxID=1295372 RepID=UPI001FB5089C|nr:hypothetical protein [Vulcanisaeta sp. JCM 16161]
MIDEESRGKDRAVNDVLTYMMGFEDRVRVVLVQPKHEPGFALGSASTRLSVGSNLRMC